jgi:LuxR family maltose regulon positive regulatory protein
MAIPRDTRLLGRPELPIPLLRKTMAMARRFGFVKRPLWTPRNLTRLIAAALESGIEPGHGQIRIRKRNLAPEVEHVQDRPWPLRIHTLGGFHIEKEGELLLFSGKVQRRPLALLKMTIALGGRAVDTRRIVDGLWPQAEGDGAEDAFASALRRLRLLLGDAAALVLQDCRLSLDARRVWVDVWALEQLFELRDAVAPDLGKVLALYRGAFLEGEDAAWVWPLRERLRNRFLRELAAGGRLLMQGGRYEEAIGLLEKGLEADELAEDLHCNLMRCYQALGRHAEALRAYERCRKLLWSALEIQPSAATEALHRQLISRP